MVNIYKEIHSLMSAAGTMPFCSLLPYIVSTLFITLHIVNSKDLNEQIIQMSSPKVCG